MTKTEKQLLEVAKQILKLNENRGLDIKLTGSLMLALRNIKKPREAHDIYFLITEECVASENDDWCPVMPKGFLMDYEGNRSSPDCIKFTNEDMNIQVDFIPAWEETEVVCGIPCGNVESCIAAKQEYADKDKSIESKNKHERDLEFIKKHNAL